ncbi:indole-3-glycerol phosphate synthase TrpC [Candidatus Aerophobetes bacterium]|nr:indole-3-glycerol phosphate synthase TrpC [Candidatus Aerophobetes bacterium]
MFQDILEKIIIFKKKEVAKKKKTLPLFRLKVRLDETQYPRDFKTSISCGDRVRIIAEIKRRSPSAGILRDNLNPAQFARLYEQNGASAISVLIDEKFFGGNLKDLQMAKGAVSLPVLAKEFIVDEYQIYEAKLYGADAILLIARMLSQEKLLKFYQTACSIQMGCIVEVHSPEDVKKILHLPFPLLVGINNRDLKNFEVNLSITERILSLLPPSSVVISESGIKTAEDIKLLRAKGVHIFLVGEAILRSSNPGEKLRELCYG